MNWNIFWGLYTLAFAVAALLVWYFLYYRKKHYTELCSVKTTGTKSFSSPFHRAKTDITSNLTTREDLPSVLKLNLRQNSLAGLTESPLLELYPIGSEVDVFYNPRKPKMAYVQRFTRPQKVLYTIVLLLGLIFLAAALFFLFGPAITMH